MERVRTLKCDTHGDTAWTGTVICTACGKVWNLTVPAECPPGKGEAPPCTCGKPLVGDRGTARAICTRCYRGKRKAQDAGAPAN